MSDWFRRHRAEYPADWDEISTRIRTLAGWRCLACDTPHGPRPFVLTTHHIDHNPPNVADDNLVALCQVCHLKAHGKHFRRLTRDALIAELRRCAAIELSQLCLPLTIADV
jgi:hypothetical protein